MTIFRTRITFLPIIVALGLAGCNGESSSSPTAPSTVQQPAPVPTPGAFPPGVLSASTLSGVVFEMTTTGPTPIEGAWMYCELCGAETHSSAFTDSNGIYSFTGVWTMPAVATPVCFSKEGYGDPAGFRHHSGAGWRDVTVNGDTRFDVELVKK